MPGLTGQIVGGYPLGRFLHVGAYTEWYEAETSAKPIAAMVPRPELRADPALGAAVAAGWEAARGVAHPNLLALFVTGLDPRCGAYALGELVKAKTLRQLVLDGIHLTWRDGLELTAQAANGLKALHDANLTHGGLTPFDVLITLDMDVKLVCAGGLAGAKPSLAAVLPPPLLGYYAPERLGGAPGSANGDLYSLGACLYYLLAGRDPFNGRDAQTVARAIREEAPPPPDDARQDIPEGGLEFLIRLLAKDPRHRYARAEDVLSDIAALKAGRPLAPPTGLPATVAPPPATVPTAPGLPTGRRPVSGTAILYKHFESASPGDGAKVAPAAPAALSLPPRPSAVESSSAPTQAGAPEPHVAQPPSAVPPAAPPARPVSATSVYSDLKAHLAATIPQSRSEKEGDEFFRRNQLAQALDAWRAAWMTGPQHPGLKAKIERAQREVRRLECEVVLKNGRAALAARKALQAQTFAEKALFLAQTPEQQTAAAQLEAAAQALVKARSGLRGTRNIILLFVILAVLLLVGAWVLMST